MIWTLLQGLAWAQDPPPTTVEAPDDDTVMEVSDREPPRFDSKPDPRILTLGLDLGHQFTDQPDYETFRGRPLMLGLGARAQLKVHDRVQLVGTWQRSQRGSRLTTSDAFPAVGAALTVDQFALGPRADIEVTEMFFPYLMAQGLLWRGQIRLDDDPTTSTNPNQLRSIGLTGGLITVAGFEIRVPDHWFSAYAEFGHRWAGSAAIGDLGTIRPRGYIQRLGVAVRL
ncbi:MAG: hypothetical protein AAGA48_28550 [Myxococcota bacterium]